MGFYHSLIKPANLSTGGLPGLLTIRGIGPLNGQSTAIRVYGRLYCHNSLDNYLYGILLKDGTEWKLPICGDFEYVSCEAHRMRPENHFRCSVSWFMGEQLAGAPK